MANLERIELERTTLKRLEAEYDTVRATLEPVLSALLMAESRLTDLKIFSAEDRLRLTRARAHLLCVLRSLEAGAQLNSEKLNRMVEEFAAEISPPMKGQR